MPEIGTSKIARRRIASTSLGDALASLLPRTQERAVGKGHGKLLRLRLQVSDHRRHRYLLSFWDNLIVASAVLGPPLW